MIEALCAIKDRSSFVSSCPSFHIAHSNSLQVSGLKTPYTPTQIHLSFQLHPGLESEDAGLRFGGYTLFSTAYISAGKLSSLLYAETIPLNSSR